MSRRGGGILASRGSQDIEANMTAID